MFCNFFFANLKKKILERIIICEDHPIYSKGLASFLKNYYNICGVFNSGKVLLNYLKTNQVDILLLDLNLIDINGLEVLEELNNQKQKPKVVIITMYNDKLLVEKCKKLGVHAFCSKHILNSELLSILNELNDDSFLVDSSIKNKLEKNKFKETKHDFVEKINLTHREKEVISLFANGLSNKEVSEKLFVSTFTIETHKKNIYKKLNIKSVAELVSYYYENL